MQQIHKHWWLWRLEEEQQGGVNTRVSEGGVDDGSEGGGDNNVEVVRVVRKLNIPLNPHRIKGKGRPAGALATASAAASKIKGHGINSTRRLPSGFEYALDDELATIIPASGSGGTKIKGMKQTKPPSTAPAAVYGSKRKQGVVDLNPGQQPKKQEPSTALQTPTRVEDCIWVACTSKDAGATADSEARNTALGLQRLEQIGNDS
jgi:hypothetical protein